MMCETFDAAGSAHSAPTREASVHWYVARGAAPAEPTSPRVVSETKAASVPFSMGSIFAAARAITPELRTGTTSRDREHEVAHAMHRYRESSRGSCRWSEADSERPQ